jgi:hypothetical protein
MPRGEGAASAVEACGYSKRYVTPSLPDQANPPVAPEKMKGIFSLVRMVRLWVVVIPSYPFVRQRAATGD